MKTASKGGWALLALAALPSAYANTIFYSGNLRTDANITACGSMCSLGAGDSDATWAQWAAISIPFTVATAGPVTAVTFGYAGGVSATGTSVMAGGFEPYLSLFDASGGFLASTYNGITCPPGAGVANGTCYDVELAAGTLAAGSYTLVLSVYQNLSLAENYGAGNLSDGFTGLGNLAANESLAYALDLNLPSQPTPEPSSGSLLLASAGLMLVAAQAKKRTADCLLRVRSRFRRDC